MLGRRYAELVYVGLWFNDLRKALQGFFDDTQKRRQVIFIWLIPFLGAILVRMALNAAERDSKSAEKNPKNDGAGPGAS